MSIYVDTHVVVWLHAGEVDRLSPSATTRIEDDDVVVSPAVLLELKLLQEIGRIPLAAERPFDFLGTRFSAGIRPAHEIQDSRMKRLLIAVSHSVTKEPQRFLLGNRRGEGGVDEAVQRNPLLLGQLLSLPLQIVF